MADIVFPGQTGTVANSASLPDNVDLVIYKGDYVELLVTIKTPAGVPVDLTDATIEAVLKNDYADRTSVEFECTPTVNPGEVSVLLPSYKTNNLLPGSYIWDFQVTINGNSRTYIAGDVTVLNDVTGGVYAPPGQT